MANRTKFSDRIIKSGYFEELDRQATLTFNEWRGEIDPSKMPPPPMEEIAEIIKQGWIGDKEDKTRRTMEIARIILGIKEEESPASRDAWNLIMAALDLLD